MSSPAAVEVLFTLEFKRSLRRLARRYRHVRRDAEPLIARIAAGETPGDRVKATGHTVYKVRVPNSDARRGGSGGYRVLYFIQTERRVVLLTIYSKSLQGDISAAAVAPDHRTGSAHERPSLNEPKHFKDMFAPGDPGCYVIGRVLAVMRKG